MCREKELVWTYAFSSFLAASHFLDSEGREVAAGLSLKEDPAVSPTWLWWEQEVIVAAPRSPGELDGPLLNRSKPVLLPAGASSTGTG